MSISKKVSKIQKRQQRPGMFTRIMLFGTFDLLHEGHKDFFRQARNLAPHPYLIVSVARDKNVEQVKGRKPLYSERQRLEFVRRTVLADCVVLGAVGDHLPHIKRQKPDIIALGYDQRGRYVVNLKNVLQQGRVCARIVRLKPFKPKVYKSSKLKKAVL